MLIPQQGFSFWHRIEQSNILMPFFLGCLSAISFILSFPLLLAIGNALLVILLQSKTFKVADRVGLSYGLAFYSAGLYWFFMIDDNYEATSHFVLTGFQILAILLMSIPFALLALFLTIFPKNRRYSLLWLVLIATPSFTLLEWTKTWYFSGFPWFQASHIFTSTLFSGWYALLGELGVSFLFYFFIFLCLYALQVRRNLRIRLMILITIIAFSIFTFVLNKISYTKAHDDKLTIQVFSDGVGLSKKNTIDDRVNAVADFQRMALSENNLDLSIWPESSTGSGEYNDIEEYLIFRFKELSDKGTEVLFGSYSKKGSQLKNSLFSGKAQQEVYTKQHLVPVGEYIPEWFSILDFWIPGSFQSSTISDDSSSTLINFKGLNVVPMICYEVMFGEEVRKRAINSNLLISIGNLNALKPKWVKKYFWNMARIRSLELQKPMAQSNSFAYAGFITPNGESEFFISDTKAYKIKKITMMEGNTPYSKYGFKLTLVLIFTSLIIGTLLISIRTPN